MSVPCPAPPSTWAPKTGALRPLTRSGPAARTSAALVAWAMGLLLSLLGCGLSEDAIERAGCRADQDCPSGRACVMTVCVRTDLPGWTLDLEARPAPSSPFVATQRTGVFIPGSGGWRVVLADPVVHETVVLGADGSPIDADLAFRPGEGLADRPIDLTHRARRERPARVPLPAGVYDVRISPLDPELPSVEVYGFSVEPGRDIRLKEFVLPSRYRRLEGFVQDRVLSSRRIEGVEVSAIGMDSGLTSTVDQSGPDGAFSLALPDSEDTTFRLTATLPEALQPAWRFEQVVLVPLGEDREKVVELDIPSSAARGALALVVIGFGPEGPVPVADARVTLTASVAASAEGRSYVVSARTDAEGRARGQGQLLLPILRGRYFAVVEPPAGSPFARTAELVDLTGAGNGVTVELQLTVTPRTRIEGLVQAPSGSPVPQARVGFEPVGRTGRFLETETGGDGRYSAALDPGDYVVVVDPRSSEASALARAAETIRVHGPSLALEPLTVPYAVPTPGVVVTEEGGPVEGVEISVFGEVTGVRHLIARGISDNQGQVVLQLPE